MRLRLMGQLCARVLMVHRWGMSRRVIVCVECGAMSATPSARGWRGYRTDDEELEEASELALY
jgi:hypothetical protein